jgi:serine O-acetyltransferase
MKELDFAEIVNQIRINGREYTKKVPNPILVKDFFNKTLEVLFPSINNSVVPETRDLEHLNRQLIELLNNSLLDSTRAEDIAGKFINDLPFLQLNLIKDAQAICQGDPAAQSVLEVILSYPGFMAIAAHRIAHEFYKEKCQIFPRLISEYAHQLTGIDIHPGAQIGESFCIDHGTGIVIGETTVIDKNVKIYQGVTLGGLSVAKNLAQKKRHPTIEENVVIYSNATILGGDTVIGKNSIIGGNVWLTTSVKPDSKVYHRSEVELK